VLLIGMGALLLLPQAHAQRARGTLSVGPQVGEPAGLTAKLYRSSRTAYDGVLTTDGDDVVTLHLHRLRERALPDSLVHLYLGPGLVVGARQLGGPPRPQLGISTQAGLNFYAERFEVFLHVTPTLRFLPDLRPGLGASVGLRYVLRWR
jgi:hypothetical protein